MSGRDLTAGFRDPEAVRRLREQIAALDPGQQIRIMHVCGTHENAICQFGLRDVLPGWMKLIAGPGCPVCVCPAADIDMAVRLAEEQGAVVCSFGDVMRVPARTSLLAARARGGDCRVVYGIDDAVRIAERTPDRQVVFFAVGFETTACATAAAVRRGLPDNFSLLVSHRLVPPALEALAASEKSTIHGYLLPGHVSVIIGVAAYRDLARRTSLPMVIAGFEPVDLLAGLERLADLVRRGEGGLFNDYPRVVREEGNPAALAAMDEVFEPADVVWRGIGVIPVSGYRLRPAYARFDARTRFAIAPDPTIRDIHPACRCGEVLLGHVEPEACPLFGNGCSPDNPVGPCMVAFEGTCHARYRHGIRRLDTVRAP